MKRIHFYLPFLLMIISCNLFGQIQILSEFEKVIVSPNIQVTFVEGDTESVLIEQCSVERSKLHIDVSNNTLSIYLEGAKDFPKGEVMNNDRNNERYPLYKGTIVKAVITYKVLNDLSIRGEDSHLIKSPIAAEKFNLKIYGESEVVFNQVDFGELQTKLYGESKLEFKAGAINKQRYTSYGESKITSLAVKGRSAYITTYGESDFSMNVSDIIKMTAFGEARLSYKGDPEIVKGIQLGEVQIERVR
jgi:hypothetical protein